MSLWAKLYDVAFVLSGAMAREVEWRALLATMPNRPRVAAPQEKDDPMNPHLSLGGLWSAIVTGAKTLWSEISGQLERDIGGAPGQTLAQAALSRAKQQASNLLAFADTEAGKLMAPAIAATETAADAFLATIPGGALADPFANATIEAGWGILHGILDHAEALAVAKAGLPVAMKPVADGVVVGPDGVARTPVAAGHVGA